MAKECNLSFQHKSLFQQGYQRFSPVELKQLEWGLRFTPASCTLIAAIGLYLQAPFVLLTVALLGMLAFFFPAAHPMDLLYNHVIARALGTVKLPPNPFQRRLACLSAGLMNSAAATLFLLGWPLTALVVGVSLIVLQLVVIFTHFCTLSWMYEGLMRVLGKWHKPLDENSVKTLIDQGAVLVDVRSQNEYAKDSIDGAHNFPLEELHNHLEHLKEEVCLLFCNSGTRSHIATEKLKALGVDEIHNIGDLDRARKIATA